MAVDYWKSTPYFVNFGDGYQLGERLRTALSDPVVRPDVRRALAKTQHLDHAKLDAFEPVDPGNARMRQLVADTVDSGWWRLLWMPPSLPYAPLSGPYAEPGVSDMTKRLIFSSWAATPTAIASLVSYAATRHIAGSRVALDGTVPRLDWRVDGGRPAAMTTLALFWPAPALALRINPTQTTSTPTSTSRTTGAEAWYWTSILSERESAPPGLDVEGAAAAVSGAADETFDPDDSRRLALHVEVALDLCGGRPRADMEPRTREPEDLATVIDEIGLFAPGNIAYRCVGRLVRPTDSATAVGHWKAAAVLANGLRSLFNRPDAILLLDQAFPETVYWRAVLQYCAAGSLEAVLDEYLHHLSAPDRSEALDDAKLMEFAVAARSAMTSRPSRYEAFDPLRPSHRIGFPSRFALRYGSKRAANDEDVRQPEIQAAFNSPFWPYVLATTSVGQEGIDFHWWCHAAVHWNTPANPVDFEQREGRVHRFGGHAIRKNLAHHHRGELLAVIRSGGNAWDAAYDLQGRPRDLPTHLRAAPAGGPRRPLETSRNP
ncbi:MAG: hypothetical protein HYU28_12555 [Actinobacteria bacterium]|nr:hypothetical protein [Actinomycetota bacterium]